MGPKKVCIAALVGIVSWQVLIHTGALANGASPGKLRIEAYPAGASVTVLDKAAGGVLSVVTPPSEIDLPAGEYTLQASAPGCFPRRRSVEVRADAKTRVYLSLEEQLVWRSRPTDEGGPAAPFAVADLNGDGVLDAIVGCGEGMVSAVSGEDGSVLWSFHAGVASRGSFVDILPPGDSKMAAGFGAMQVAKGSPLFPSRQVADLNSDGVPDCVAGAADGCVYALNGRNGAAIWKVQTKGPIASSPAIAELDGDDIADVVVGSGDHGVYAISGKDHSILWRCETGGPVFSSPAVADLNGDGVPDCVVGSDDGNVYAIEGRDGAVLWKAATKGAVRSSPAVGDLNGDGVPDVVVGSDDRSVYALNGKDGSVLWQAATGGEVISSPALADLDGDGGLDCVVGSADCHVYALSGKDGGVLWKHRTSARVTSSPVTANLDGDGLADCIVGSDDHRAYALSGKDGSVLWQYEAPSRVASPVCADLCGDGRLHCLLGSADGTLHLVAARDGATLWTAAADDRVIGAVQVAELDGDASPDCVFSSQDGTVRALSGADGRVLWMAPCAKDATAVSALADLNKDGTPDGVVGDGKKVQAISGKDGALLWSCENVGTSWTPAIADMDGDGEADAVVASADRQLYALSGKDGSILWKQAIEADVSCAPQVADLGADGVPGCVLGCADGRVLAISGKDRSVLWKFDANEVNKPWGAGGVAWVLLSPAQGDRGSLCMAGLSCGRVCLLSGKDGAFLRSWSRTAAGPSPAAFVDRNGNGTLDCVDGDLDLNRCPCVLVRSGSDGAVLWSHRADGSVLTTPAVADFDGDKAPDFAVGDEAGRIHVLSGKDGSRLWRGRVSGKPSCVCLADLDQDGVPDPIVVTGGVVRAYACGKGPSDDAGAFTRIGERRQSEDWGALLEEATACLESSKDPWTQGVCWTNVGLARLYLYDPEGALAAFAEARKLGLRSPEAAAFEWLAAWRWKGCPAARLVEARGVLREAIASKPHSVFDGFCEVRHLFTEAALEDFRGMERQAAPHDDARLATAMIASCPPRRLVELPLYAEYKPEAMKELEQLVLGKLRTVTPTTSRWYAYLALLADMQGDWNRFARYYEVYRTLPNRRTPLDVFLAERAQADRRDAGYIPREHMPDWQLWILDGADQFNAGDYVGARKTLERALGSVDPNIFAAKLPPSRRSLQFAHYLLARIYALASVGKDSPFAAPHAVEAAEVAHLQEGAFRHLRAAFDAVVPDPSRVRDAATSESDLAPLRDDARWKELFAPHDK